MAFLGVDSGIVHSSGWATSPRVIYLSESHLENGDNEVHLVQNGSRNVTAITLTLCRTEPPWQGTASGQRKGV